MHSEPFSSAKNTKASPLNTSTGQKMQKQSWRTVRRGRKVNNYAGEGFSGMKNGKVKLYHCDFAGKAPDFLKKRRFILERPIF